MQNVYDGTNLRGNGAGEVTPNLFIFYFCTDKILRISIKIFFFFLHWCEGN